MRKGLGRCGQHGLSITKQDLVSMLTFLLWITIGNANIHNNQSRRGSVTIATKEASVWAAVIKSLSVCMAPCGLCNCS